ncbi:MAG TPA: rod shape-determining protein RodA [Candidatus Paceibacterota bacterium]|nr:rod shape-determining protein RodA [Candidatus Paceibacterota bacterium]HPI82722.1 rod shape-determining protein RodA [Candidatus Paceibacterota bacterium]HPR84138.1 rod shape-determining protein RodA [Candidatus Paceibacterota bacterium]
MLSGLKLSQPKKRSFFGNIDWLLLLFIVPVLGAGLVTMNSFTGESVLFNHQIIWIIISLIAFFILASFDFSFIKRTDVLVVLYIFFTSLLLLLFIFGHRAGGAQSWFSFGGFSFQPSDLMKLILILMLAKYFSRRHIEIGNFKHIFISGLYAFIPFVLIFLQPDLGSAIIIALIWLGMILVSGISKKHLLIVFGVVALAFGLLWNFSFQDYQKARIINFFSPLSDIQNTGYNAYQSTIAVGSGRLMGKGVGFGTQSRLKFLPEYETDFIFAAFSEEWGFVGVIIIFILYALIIWRILHLALLGKNNFEILFGVGLAIYFMSHLIINIGMNIGLMPVTGITLPFMSYGGSHLLTEFVGLGIFMSMNRYRRVVHRDDMKNEFLGI